MPENENQPPPVPSKQTSSVPLKKETVRVTLKAADAPPSVPSATVPLAPPPAPPVRPPVPGAPSAPPPAPTTPAPSAPIRPTAAPAPTIRLASAGQTSALRPGGGGPTPTLPKATVQLQPPTQPLGAVFPPQVSLAKAEDLEEEEEPHALLMKVLSGVGFAAALVVLVLQLMMANTWIGVPDNPKAGDWMQLLEL